MLDAGKTTTTNVATPNPGILSRRDKNGDCVGVFVMLWEKLTLESDAHLRRLPTTKSANSDPSEAKSVLDSERARELCPQ